MPPACPDVSPLEGKSTMSEQVLDYDHLEACLRDNGLACTPSWLHGLIFGLVAAHDDRWETVLGAMRACDPSLASAETLTRSLCHALWQSLDGPGLEFGVLLPDDSRPLGKRVAELAAWARGCLQGMERAGVSAETLPVEAGGHAMEALRAVAEGIAEDPPAEEEALEEAVEHTWVTAVLLRELLVVTRESGA